MPATTGTLTSGLNHVVERQMRNWEISRRQRLEDALPQPRPVADFICISREVGSGGREVAEWVAQRMEWPLFDREILDLMANHDEVRKRVYESLDERDLSWVEETLRSFVDASFARNDFFRRLSETVLSLARKANAVFLGRGASLVLPRQAGFRVRIIAPMEDRVMRFAERRHLAVDAARQEVLRLDQERREYIRQYFKTDEFNLLRFDLLVNMSRYTPATAGELILAAHRLARKQS